MSETTSVSDTESDSPDTDTYTAQLEREITRLREEYAAARRLQYRRTAIGLGFVGLLALAGAVFLQPIRDVLVVLGATGVFAAIVTYYLTPETFLPADVGERVSADLADNIGSLVVELGLTADRIYIPLSDQQRSRVKLFVPRLETYDVPEPTALDDLFVVSEQMHTSGVALTPTGSSLFARFEEARRAPLADDPVRLVEQLATGLTDALEIAGGVETELVDDTTLTIRIFENRFGDTTQFDHPAASFIAVGLALSVDTAVSVEYHDTDTPSTLRATYRWDVSSSN